MTSTVGTRGTLRVASVPATHVYVRRLEHPHVTRLEDPTGDDLRTPRFLDPAWWREEEEVPELLHIHFGFEFYDPHQLADLAEAVRERDVPLVFTVHDLRNPNHETRELHDSGLDVLVAAADELVTLTEMAALRIEERWARDAHVLPHPHVAELDRIRTAARRADLCAGGDRYRLLIHFKSLRANMVRMPLLRAAAQVARERDDLDLEVRMHCDVVSPSGDNHDPDLVSLACELSDEGLVDLRVHPYLSHDDLLDVIEVADGFVLPYRFGTHSGLLELCRDLGTAVIAPSCGAYADQGVAELYRSGEHGGFDGDSLRAAVHRAVDAGPSPPLAPAFRERQRHAVADAYVEIYRRALDRLGDGSEPGTVVSRAVPCEVLGRVGDRQMGQWSG